VTFNLDEYYPDVAGQHPRYHRYMWENLFEHIDIKRENVHIPRGDIPRETWPPLPRLRGRDRAARRHRLPDPRHRQDGHIGFNEPGSAANRVTRLVHLDTITRKDAAADFFGEENVPREAITMGVATIMDAREIVLIATGEHKAPSCASVEGEISHEVAATYLQEHNT
jgi:glucosamine-6-phosphate deaminase